MTKTRNHFLVWDIHNFFVTTGCVCVIVLVTFFGFNLAQTSAKVTQFETVTQERFFEAYGAISPDTVPETPTVVSGSLENVFVGLSEEAKIYHTLTAPDGETPPNSFTADATDMKQWLTSEGFDGVEPVFLSDPTINCGLANIQAYEAGKYNAGGCYNVKYGNTVFMWWNENAPDNVKQFVLLHELSHYYQNATFFNEFAVAYTPQFVGIRDEVALLKETDATCRVIHSWGYTHLAEAGEKTTSPCGDAVWHEGWLVDQLKLLGITT